LGARTAALAVVVLRLNGLPAAITWNLASAAAMAYMVQGFGIATFFLKRRNAPRGLRIVLAAVCVLTLFTSGPGAVILAIVLTLLGVTETWIPYRNLKESDHESNT